MSFKFRGFSSITLWTLSSFHFLFSLLEIPIKSWNISHTNPLVFFFFCFAGFGLLSRKFLQLYLPTFIEYLISAVFFFSRPISYFQIKISYPCFHGCVAVSLSISLFLLFCMCGFFFNVFFCYLLLLFLLNSLFCSYNFCLSVLDVFLKCPTLLGSPFTFKKLFV